MVANKAVRFVLVGLLLMLVMVGVVSAHEHRQVEGYELVFGWEIEPAFAAQMNQITLRVNAIAEESEATEEPEGDHVEGEEHHEELMGVTGAEATLQLEVTFGDQTRSLTLRPAWRDPGYYIADIMPTRAGDYVFHLTGNINGVEVDETFDSSVDSFSTVELLEDVQFPQVLPSTLDLLARIEALEAQIAELTAGS